LLHTYLSQPPEFYESPRQTAHYHIFISDAALGWLRSKKIEVEFVGVKSFVLISQQFSKQIYTVFIVQAYQTSQYVVPRGGIFLGNWRSSFAGSCRR
jgi:hypothetical protein